ncbi:unnamed protein product [Porites evermanni]|uniref:Uncharacterized protein n=1 Tax=Porites evermanni TaxID=104178 RepID=A0ABN8RSX8_9CNID|nr:unnamed protein product [Porites evermanni]
MKKGKVYTVKVITNLRGHISKAVCGYPAAVDGRCNHLPNNEVFTSAANTAGPVSHQETYVPCTSKPCQWNLPEKKETKCRNHTVFEVSKTRIW